MCSTDSPSTRLDICGNDRADNGHQHKKLLAGYKKNNRSTWPSTTSTKLTRPNSSAPPTSRPRPPPAPQLRLRFLPPVGSRSWPPRPKPSLHPEHLTAHLLRGLIFPHLLNIPVRGLKQLVWGDLFDHLLPYNQSVHGVFIWGFEHNPGLNDRHLRVQLHNWSPNTAAELGQRLLPLDIHQPAVPDDLQLFYFWGHISRHAALLPQCEHDFADTLKSTNYQLLFDPTVNSSSQYTL